MGDAMMYTKKALGLSIESVYPYVTSVSQRARERERERESAIFRLSREKHDENCERNCVFDLKVQ